SFCLPVKNGWHAEQISTLISPLWLDRVTNALPQAQCTRTSLYAGWMAAFMTLRHLSVKLLFYRERPRFGNLRAILMLQGAARIHRSARDGAVFSCKTVGSS